VKGRVFVDALLDERCTATIVLRDKSEAQCGRRRASGTLCKQHYEMARMLSSKLNRVLGTTRPTP
jgi:hypothetical protein